MSPGPGPVHRIFGRPPSGAGAGIRVVPRSSPPPAPGLSFQTVTKSDHPSPAGCAMLRKMNSSNQASTGLRIESELAELARLLGEVARCPCDPMFERTRTVLRHLRV